MKGRKESFPIGEHAREQGGGPLNERCMPNVQQLRYLFGNAHLLINRVYKKENRRITSA